MKTNTSLCLLAGLTILVSGCFPFKVVEGDGNVTTQTISITDYDEIESSGNITFNYTQKADAPFLEVTTDRNIYDMYEFRIEEGHKLVIQPKKEFRHGTSFRPTSFVVNTNSTMLRDAEMGGDTRFTVIGPLTTNELDLDLGGSGSLSLQDTVRAEKVKVGIAGSGEVRITYAECLLFKGEIAGSGSIFASGTADEAEFNIAGSGDIRGFDLVVKKMEGEIAGNGTIDIHATERIHVKGAGSGEVNYKGNPSDVNSSIVGSGKLRAVD